MEAEAPQASAPHMAVHTFHDGFDEVQLRGLVVSGSLSFDDWTSLISAVENAYPDDREKLCLVYDSFLCEFPLCHGYWRKYADHKMRLCSVQQVVDVFEQAVLSATYSVDVWVEYCHFGMLAFEDPDDVRRLFRRGLSFVGKDYLCHCLWDKYIEFELSQQQWISLAHIYVQTLRFPTKKLQYYYDSFKKLVGVCKKEIVNTSKPDMEYNRESKIQSEMQTFVKDDEIASVVGNLLGPTNGLDRSRALHKYMNIGEKLYNESYQMDEKIRGFESCIRRSYFHMKPLDDNQLENWHKYLDFVEKQEDFDWVVKLYERCLIPAANYPEFWMRYVHFVENKGGRELANSALDRAVGIFLKRTPEIHVYNARFKEKIGDVLGAGAALAHICTELDTDFVEDTIMKANMEKRCVGKPYDCIEYLQRSARQGHVKRKISLSTHFIFALFTAYVFGMIATKLEVPTNNNAVLFTPLYSAYTTGSVPAALDILVNAIKHLPHCKLLYEELIRFAMNHEGMEHMNVVETVVANALYLQSSESQVLDSKDGEDISNLYLKYVDQCGGIYDVMKAWNWHVRKFPCSLRTSVFSKATTGTTIKSFKIILEEKRRSCGIETDESLGDDCCDIPKYSVQEEVSSVWGDGDRSPEEANPGERSNSLPLPSHEVQRGSAAIHQQDSGASDDGESQRAKTALQQSRDNSPHSLDVDLVGDEAAKEAALVQSDLTCSKDKNQSGHDVTNSESMPVLLKTLSLHPQEDRTSGSLSSFFHDGETSDEPRVTNEILLVGGSQETSPSSESLSGSGYSSYQDPKKFHPFGVQGCGGADTQRQANKASYTGSHQDHYSSRTLSNQHEPANRGQSWHHDRVRRDSRFGSRGHLRKKSQHQHESSHSTHGQGKMGGQLNQQGIVAKNPYQAATQGNIMSPHAWPVQNVQPQNFAHGPVSQLPVQSAAYPQAQMFQYPPQNAEHYGQMQNTIAYNQMWQYYYYQQQQFMQQQQQPQQQQAQHQQLSQQPCQQQEVFCHPQQQWQQQLQLNQQYQQLQVQQLLPHQQLNDNEQLPQEQPLPWQQPLPQKPDAPNEHHAEHQNQESEMLCVQQQKIQQGAGGEQEKREGIHEAVDSASEN